MSTPDPVTTLEARVTALENKTKTEVSAVVTFVKTNWAHFVTWALVAAGPSILKFVHL